MNRIYLLGSLWFAGCVPTELIVPASDSTPPSAVWLQADIPDQPLANVVLDGADASAEMRDNDQVVVSARADDPDGGIRRLSIWSTMTRTRPGVQEGPSLVGAPEVEFLSTASVGQVAHASESVQWDIDVEPLIGAYHDVYLDVWADAENFHGGVSTTAMLTLHVQRIGLHLHVVALSDDDGGHAPQVTADQFTDVVDRTNVSFAGTGLVLRYDPATDFEVRADTAMNDDSSIFADGNALADSLPGEILVLLRWGSDPGAVTGNGNAYPPPGAGSRPPSVADADQRYVALPSLYPADDSYLKLHNGGFVAHEMGHYLGLYHTFPGWDGVNPVYGSHTTSVADLDQALVDYVEANGGTVDALDGDRMPDTAPDPGVMAFVVHGQDPCTAPSLTATGLDATGAAVSFEFDPPVANAMSYYARCGTAPGGFSAQQIARMHHVLTVPQRAHLIEP